MIPRPIALPVNPETIPVEMRAEAGRFCVWRFTFLDGTWKKIPYRVDDPATEAAVNDPAQWNSFEQALRVYQGGTFDGIGFLLGDGWAGVDLDDCRNPDTGELSALAIEVLKQLNSYGEISPSGTGLKIFLKAWPGRNHSKAGVEVYGSSRYFTLTGARV